MSAENAWRIAMEAAMAEAEEVEINPIPSLWNFGTTPRPADRAEWKGRKEGAQDVRVLLASLPMPPAFRAEVEAEAERVKLAIAKRLDEEADMTPCEEDAGVIRGCANLVRVDFSYDAADAVEAEAEEMRSALVQIAALVPAHIAGEIARKALSRLEAKGEEKP